MKKISILLAPSFILISLLSNAQVSKGAVFLGGNISGGSQKVTTNNGTGSNKQSNFNIMPVVGKVYKDNLVIGGDIGYSMYDFKVDNSSAKQKRSGYSAGIFLRQYRPLGKGFYVFLQERVGYNFDKYEAANLYSNPSDYKRHSVGINANPGLSYAVNKKFHIETGFNNLFYLNYYTEKGNNYNGSNGQYKSNNFSAGVDLSGYSSLYFGFRLLLNK